MDAAPISDNTYVEDLPEGIDSDMVKQVFAQYGATVSQCRVMNDKAKNGMVHALVRFTSADEASQVVEKLNNQILEGLENPVKIRFANPGGASGGGQGQSAYGKVAAGGKSQSGPYEGKGGKGGPPAGAGSLYVAGLPAECDKDMLNTLFSEFGTVTRCSMLKSNNHPSGKRAGLVEYATAEEAQQVIDLFHNQVIPGLVDPVQIEYNYAALEAQGKAAPTSKVAKGSGKATSMPASKPDAVKPDAGKPTAGKPTAGGAKSASKGADKGGKLELAPDDSIRAIVDGLEASGAMPGGKWVENDERTLFVGGLPLDTTEGDIYRIFSPFGAILPAGVKVLMAAGGTCTGVAFVSYIEAVFAQNAITVLNGCQLPNGGILTVKVKEDKAAKGAKASGKGKWGKDAEAEPKKAWRGW